MLTETAPETMLRKSEGPLLKGIDYIEFYVGNPLQSAYFYRSLFGFKMTAQAGLETGVRDRTSWLVESNKVRLVLTGALSADSPIAEHVRVHGDGIKDIAFIVDDAVQAFELAVRQGARPVLEPELREDDNGLLLKATVAVYGDTVHSFVERRAYRDAFMPGFQEFKQISADDSLGIQRIDHVAFNVEQGTLDRWIEFYQEVLNFEEVHRESVSTGVSAMNSKVVGNSERNILFPIVEPAPAKKRSQIDEYLSYHNGSGVQHIALYSDNIVETVRCLRARGIEFLRTPNTYYDMLEDRVGKIEPDLLKAIQEQNILVDRDEWGSLMQIFSKPVQGRPTFFLEVIQRNGARTFGGGNIKALFEAVEREQAMRGNV